MTTQKQKVKCKDCENLLQCFMIPCHGHIIESANYFAEKPNMATELSTWDFTCDCDYNKVLSRNDIEKKRECKDFTAIEKLEE